MMNRRRFLSASALIIAAPAIVRYEWLMPVKKVIDDGLIPLSYADAWLDPIMEHSINYRETTTAHGFNIQQWRKEQLRDGYLEKNFWRENQNAEWRARDEWLFKKVRERYHEQT